MGILKVITIEKLQKFYDDLKIKIKNNHYTKTEIDDKLKNVNIDTSSLLDKATYDSDNDGIIDIAKTLDGMSEENLNKMIEIINMLEGSNPQQYIGTNLDNELGLYYLPTTNSNIGNKIEQRVALNVKVGDMIPIESVADMQDQKAFIQVFNYVEGEQDKISTLKEFNNANAENFIYNTDNIEFDESCHIKNKYVLDNSLNNVSGLYETKLDKSKFIELVGLTSEVSE